MKKLYLIASTFISLVTRKAELVVIVRWPFVFFLISCLFTLLSFIKVTIFVLREEELFIYYGHSLIFTCAIFLNRFCSVIYMVKISPGLLFAF